ncbi:MAG: Gfo/Idh/MocA family oxidoreductase [Sphaerochaetaceae bacterium]
MKRFVLIGYGWRALFYVRVARNLHNEFSIVSWVVRFRERAETLSDEYHLDTTVDLEKALSLEHDFVVLSVPPKANKELLLSLINRGEHILSETSFTSQSFDDLKEIENAQRSSTASVEISEQYHVYPYFQAVKRLQPLLGQITECSIECVHDHHAISLLRFFLDTGFAGCSIDAHRIESPLVRTGSREGVDDKGEIISSNRLLALLQFPNGKSGYINFCNDQYHSQIRSSHFALYGTRGELYDNNLCHLDDSNLLVKKNLVTTEKGIFCNDTLLAPQAEGLSQDETAIASCLRQIGQGYSLKEGLWDARLAKYVQQSAQEHREKEVNGEE